MMLGDVAVGAEDQCAPTAPLRRLSAVAQAWR